MEEYHIPGIVLMENAARGVVAAARQMMRGGGRRVLILCGGGNNGGDGLAVARHLHNEGFETIIGLCTGPERYSGDALANWQIVDAMGLRVEKATAKLIAGSEAGLLIDAIFGTGLSAAPRPTFEEYVEAVERAGSPVLAVDVPSGLDCDSGEPLGACIRATRTVTFVAQKAGFANAKSRQFTGKVSVAGIGCPKELIERVLNRG